MALAFNPPSKKRPDGSWQLNLNRLPGPPPGWVVLLPDGLACPNVVLEVAVNHELSNQLISDCNHYFSNDTSVTVWIGVKIYVHSRKFWVGWAERAAGGTGAAIHTQMQFPPNHKSYAQPVGIIYHIPMATVFGVGVPVPAGLSATLDIDTDEIAQRIVDCNF
jgi:hypothetical protein